MSVSFDVICEHVNLPRPYPRIYYCMNKRQTWFKLTMSLLWIVATDALRLARSDGLAALGSLEARSASLSISHGGLVEAGVRDSGSVETRSARGLKARFAKSSELAATAGEMGPDVK